MDAGPEPLLSVVVTSRNDNHGQGLLRRMQAFVNALIGQCQRHNLHAELVIVEWNPPADRPPLSEALRWPADPSPCEVRIIEVPEHLHRRLRHSESLPLFQMIAKNVGIRRARGKYVLATNIDIILNDELVRFIVSGGLRPGRMYRIDRHDVMAEVPVDAPVEEQLRYCETHYLRINSREGTFPLTPDGQRVLEPVDVAVPEDGILFEEGWSPVRDIGQEPIRWAGQDAVLKVRGPDGPPRNLYLELQPGPAFKARPFRMQVLDQTGYCVAWGKVEGRQMVHLALPLEPGQVRYFKLRVAGEIPGAPQDPRAMVYALHKCGWSQGVRTPTDPVPSPFAFNFYAEDFGALLAEDVTTADTGVCFGAGWYRVETEDEERFRWADNKATLVVQVPAGPPRALALEIKPRPNANGKPMVLEVFDRAGNLLARTTVRGRQVVHFNIPLAPRVTERLVLQVAGPSPTPTGTKRSVFYRLFGCRWTRPLQQPESEAPGPGRSFNAVAEDVPPRRKKGRLDGVVKRLSWLLFGGRKPSPNPAKAVSAARKAAAAAEPDTPVYLHTNACGDFTLMAREHWFDLRGNPEFEIFSLHLDSLMCCIAHHGGVEEEVLQSPMRVYHIEHGSGWTPEEAAKLMERMAAKAIPVLHYKEKLAWGFEMRRYNGPLITNPSDWGLGNEQLPESRLGPAHQRRAA